jgi:hypothetical protein
MAMVRDSFLGNFIYLLVERHNQRHLLIVHFYARIAHLGEPIKGTVKKSWLNESVLVRDNQFFDGKGLDGPPTFSVAMGLFLAWFLVWLSMVFGYSN